MTLIKPFFMSNGQIVPNKYTVYCRIIAEFHDHDGLNSIEEFINGNIIAFEYYKGSFNHIIILFSEGTITIRGREKPIRPYNHELKEIQRTFHLGNPNYLNEIVEFWNKIL